MLHRAKIAVMSVNLNVNLTVNQHSLLSGIALAEMRRLFDAEYRADFGDWDPDGPYGYAPADWHVLAWLGRRLVGHVGFQRRVIEVGGVEVAVAGTGGMLVAPEARGCGVGKRLLFRAQRSMIKDAKLDFGYLGCRPAVVGFYESAGWVRIRAQESHTDRLDPALTVVNDSSPILICPALRPVTEWPNGDVDLRGGAW
ncbi:GNAT family N-acetyltransferase [Dermabacteraceae bacterium TAE3-ERU27]|nr:GNAT family N-acetyltransferase [Dermabacteraceae bacterium TAE3-ERU27]